MSRIRIAAIAFVVACLALFALPANAAGPTFTAPAKSYVGAQYVTLTATGPLTFTLSNTTWTPDPTQNTGGCSAQIIGSATEPSNPLRIVGVCKTAGSVTGWLSEGSVLVRAATVPSTSFTLTDTPAPAPAAVTASSTAGTIYKWSTNVPDTYNCRQIQQVGVSLKFTDNRNCSWKHTAVKFPEAWATASGTTLTVTPSFDVTSVTNQELQVYVDGVLELSIPLSPITNLALRNNVTVPAGQHVVLVRFAHPAALGGTNSITATVQLS